VKKNNKLLDLYQMLIAVMFIVEAEETVIIWPHEQDSQFVNGMSFSSCKFFLII